MTGISILCPTRERPHLIREMIHSAVKTAAGPLQVVFFDDDDDLPTHDQLGLLRWAAGSDPDYRGLGIGEVRRQRGTVPMSDMWNYCADVALNSQPHWPLLFIDDEAIFHTKEWDQTIVRALAGYPDGSALVYPDDTIHGAVLGAYFAVAPTWVTIFGRLTPRQFTYGYADVWCFEVAKAADRAIYLPGVVIENRAPKLQPPDLVHQENQARAERDHPGDLYNATQPEREADVLALRAWIASAPLDWYWMED